jgi:hypothetical protein
MPASKSRKTRAVRNTKQIPLYLSSKQFGNLINKHKAIMYKHVEKTGQTRYPITLSVDKISKIEKAQELGKSCRLKLTLEELNSARLLHGEGFCNAELRLL